MIDRPAININCRTGSKNTELPALMYIHGFLSGANGSKKQLLQSRFGDKYRIVAPEVDADPESALRILNDVIKNESPAIIVGTSLGGWMTVMCDSPDSSQLVVVNPSLFPHETLSRWLDLPRAYFCERLDGVQTYTVSRPVLDKYAAVDSIAEIKRKSGRIHALCSTQDELLGTRHIDALTPVLASERLKVVDDFGHQCRDAGLSHLFEIIDNLTGV